MAHTVHTVSSVIGEGVKALPPIVVTTATFIGFSLQEWVYIATLVYTVLQLFVLIRDKFWRKRGRK